MTDNSQQSANEIRKVIQQNAAKATRLLVEFAKEYAIDNSLVHKAIILSNDYARAGSDEARLQVGQEMSKLLNEIVDDHINKSDTKQSQRKKATQKAIEEFYSHLEPRRDVVVKGKSLTMTYKKRNFTLSDVDIELRLGEITGVVGENANGKTTLFEIIVGNLAINSGELRFPYLQKNGKLHWPSIKNQIAYVPQSLPSWHGSLKDNLHFEAATHGIKGEKNKEDVKFIIHRLDLVDYLGLKWKQLSGGYKMRFALAKALVWKPKLLVLDEPLAHLDIKAQLTILNDIRDLSKSLRFPLAVIISSQHLHEIENVSDNLIFLQEGRAIFNGKTDDLGNTREHDTFEFTTPLSLQELEEKLRDFSYNSLTYNGLYFVITTSTRVSQSGVLQALSSRGIDISYFRNTSHSSKQLFR